MELNINYLSTSRTARYITYGNLNAQTKFFWFVLHGSKMIAEQMIYKFAYFDPETHFVVAPEAMNKTYLDGFGGEVVASWMTSRDRLHEIEDISNYLNQLYLQFDPQIPTNCKKIILGFSQGGTMLFRWLHAKKVRLDFILAYASWIPEDINLKNSKTHLAKIKKVFTYGKKDPFLTANRLDQINKIINLNELNITLEPYEGVHKIDKQQILFILKKYLVSK